MVGPERVLALAVRTDVGRVGALVDVDADGSVVGIHDQAETFVAHAGNATFGDGKTGGVLATGNHLAPGWAAVPGCADETVSADAAWNVGV